MTDTDQLELEVEARPPRMRRKRSWIEPRIIHHFRSLGYSIGLRSRNREVSSQDVAMGWRRMQIEDVSDPLIKEMIEESFEIDKGLIYRGSWILMFRTLKARAEELEEIEENKRLIENPNYILETFDENIGELAKSTGVSGGVGITRAETPQRSPQDDTIGGMDAVEEGLVTSDLVQALEEVKRSKK